MIIICLIVSYIVPFTAVLCTCVDVCTTDLEANPVYRHRKLVINPVSTVSIQVKCKLIKRKKIQWKQLTRNFIFEFWNLNHAKSTIILYCFLSVVAWIVSVLPEKSHNFAEPPSSYVHPRFASLAWNIDWVRWRFTVHFLPGNPDSSHTA